LRDQVHQAVAEQRVDELERLVEANPRAVRFLVGLTYHQDAARRETACRGVALAARYHPKLIRSVINRLVTAMAGEGGNYGATAPAVLTAIAGERPELLAPVVPDLLQATTDPEMQPEVATCLQLVAKACPDLVSGHMKALINAPTGRDN